MSSDPVGKLDGAVGEMEELGNEDCMGRDGDGSEIQECGMGRPRPLDRGPGITPPNDGCNV